MTVCCLAQVQRLIDHLSGQVMMHIAGRLEQLNDQKFSLVRVIVGTVRGNSVDASKSEVQRPALREKRSSGSRLFGAASSNAHLPRGRPWNRPKLRLHRRLNRQYIPAPLCGWRCRGQSHSSTRSSLLFDMQGSDKLDAQRLYRVNLRRDIKDRLQSLC